MQSCRIGICTHGTLQPSNPQAPASHALTLSCVKSKTSMGLACRRRRTTTSVRGTGPPAGRTAPSGTYDPRLLVQPSRAFAGALPRIKPHVKRCRDGVMTAGQRSARCPVVDMSCCLVLSGGCSAHGGTERLRQQILPRLNCAAPCHLRMQ